MPKKVGAKMGALFHITFNVKWFGHIALVLNGYPHTVMKRYYHAVKLQGASNRQEDVEEPIPANHVKGLGQVYEGYVEGLLAFPALLL